MSGTGWDEEETDAPAAIVVATECGGVSGREAGQSGQGQPQLRERPAAATGGPLAASSLAETAGQTLP